MENGLVRSSEFQVLSEERGELSGPEAREMLQKTLRLMEGMADMVRLTCERMTELEQRLRVLEKVTPAQAAELNRAIRERAEAVCDEYLASGSEKEAAAAIRKSVRLLTGVRSAREIPRCEFETVLSAVRGWDEYKTMTAIKRRAER